MAGIEGIGTGLSLKREEKLKEPEEYLVILLNDDYTTMEFVIAVLVAVFQKSQSDATKIMRDVHKKGRGSVGTYPWDIAVTKAEQVHTMAREHEYPLRCIVEKA